MQIIQIDGDLHGDLANVYWCAVKDDLFFQVNYVIILIYLSAQEYKKGSVEDYCGNLKWSPKKAGQALG